MRMVGGSLAAIQDQCHAAHMDKEVSANSDSTSDRDSNISIGDEILLVDE